MILWYWEVMNPPHLRSPSELSYLGSRSLASSCQPERYGQTHPSQLSQLSIKRNVEKVFSWANPGKISKKFWNAANSFFDTAYIYIDSTHWVPLEIRSNIYYVQSFACTAFAHHWNIFRTSKYFWRVLKYGQTNPSRIGREVSLPREISLFSFTLWIQRMEEFGKGGHF